MPKLKPEQIKLYRRVFHQERDKGESVQWANEQGLAAVKAWDESGAFDAPVESDVKADIDALKAAMVNVEKALKPMLTVVAPNEPIAPFTVAVSLDGWCAQSHVMKAGFIHDLTVSNRPVALSATIGALTSRGANLLPLIRDKGLIVALAEYAKANA